MGDKERGRRRVGGGPWGGEWGGGKGKCRR